MKKILIAVGALLALSAQASGSFPDKAVNVIVPFPAGGSTDMVARTVALSMGEQLGKALVDALNRLMPFLPQLVQSVVDLALAMIPLLPQFADLAISLLPLLMDIVVATMPHIIKLVNKFTEFAVAVMP